MDEVVIVDYDPSWPTRFEQECRRLRQVFPAARIEHIGSTSVRGLAAKPIIDLMVGLPSLQSQEHVQGLADLGYEARGPQGVPERLFFVKRNEAQVRTHHVHVAAHNSIFWKDHLLFRELLRSDPVEARRYETHKRDLATRFRRERALYTAAKSRYIEDVIRPRLDLSGVCPAGMAKSG